MYPDVDPAALLIVCCAGAAVDVYADCLPTAVRIWLCALLAVCLQTTPKRICSRIPHVSSVAVDQVFCGCRLGSAVAVLGTACAISCS